MAKIEDIFYKDIKHKNDLKRTTTGDLETIIGLDNVKEALFRRLMTSRGAIIHRPDYGVGVKDFQNAPNSLAMRRKLAVAIKEQFESDERVEEVVSVRFDSEDLTPETINIRVRVNLIGYGEQEITFIPFGGEVL